MSLSFENPSGFVSAASGGELRLNYTGKFQVSNEETPTLNFEKSLAELETLIEQMESGDMTLEDSLQAFERGVKLTRECQKALNQAEEKVQILTQNSVQAELEPFGREN